MFLECHCGCVYMDEISRNVVIIEILKKKRMDYKCFKFLQKCMNKVERMLGFYTNFSRDNIDRH